MLTCWLRALCWSFALVKHSYLVYCWAFWSIVSQNCNLEGNLAYSVNHTDMRSELLRARGLSAATVRLLTARYLPLPSRISFLWLCAAQQDHPDASGGPSSVWTEHCVLVRHGKAAVTSFETWLCSFQLSQGPATPHRSFWREIVSVQLSFWWIFAEAFKVQFMQ